jgi:hypothetical protein
MLMQAAYLPITWMRACGVYGITMHTQAVINTLSNGIYIVYVPRYLQTILDKYEGKTVQWRVRYVRSMEEEKDDGSACYWLHQSVCYWAIRTDDA